MWSRSIQPNVRLSPEKHDKKNTQNPNPVHRSLNLYGWGPRREAAMLCLMFISVLIVVRKLAHVIIRSDKSTQRSNKIINHEKKYPLQLFWKTLLQTWDVLHLKCIFFSSKHCVIYIHWFFLIFKTTKMNFFPRRSCQYSHSLHWSNVRWPVYVILRTICFIWVYQHISSCTHKPL